VFELTEPVRQAYAEFALSFAVFCQLTLDQKAQFASTFESEVGSLPQVKGASTFSPNQFHGYSQIQGLKEQFMIRHGGHGSQLAFPASFPIDPEKKLDPFFWDKKTTHFGQSALRLYALLDHICRSVLYEVASDLRMSRSSVEKINDPLEIPVSKALEVPAVHTDSTSPNGIDVCSSDYLHEGYISSSILDVFHYFNRFRSHPQSKSKFKNNHLSHSDSGILTLVPCADEPGLEVFDQKEKVWIALEKIIHEAAAQMNNEETNAAQQEPSISRLARYAMLSTSSPQTQNQGPKRIVPPAHRRFATIFWSDSYIYFCPNRAAECMHRVSICDDERYSIVYKMRTNPLTTAPRYQEDYILGRQQLSALDHLNIQFPSSNSTSDNKPRQQNWGHVAVVATLVVATTILLWAKKLRN